VSEPTTGGQTRIERIFAFMVAGIVGLSLLCFIATMIAGATGMAREDFAEGIWPLVSFVPLIGLPIGFLLIVTLLVIGIVRRNRENAAAKKQRG